MSKYNYQQLYSQYHLNEKNQQLQQQLGSYLSQSTEESRPVIDFTEPDVEYQYWKEASVTDFADFQQQLIERSIALHHPKYMGHQVAVPLPDIALLGATSDLLNNGMGIYEMGAAGTAMERVCIDYFAAAIGYSDGASGFLTSGGTLGNLTALLAARAKAKSRHPKQEKWALMVSEQAHFCVERAGITMGLSNDDIIKVKTMPNYQMDMSDLKKRYKRALSDGYQIIAVIASECSTSTGTYDQLDEIVDFCQNNDLWLHVDGAHGGAAIFSDKLKAKLLPSVELADSIVIDAHKMMLVPALATAVVFKNGDDSYNSFKQKADYLFGKNLKDPHNLAKRTYETTKYLMSIKVYYLLKKYGPQIVADYVERQYGLAHQMWDYLGRESDYECAHEPMSNILCFRYIPKNEDINTINQQIREQILNEGEYYIVSTVLRGEYYLRVTLMNPLTEWQHILSLIQTIREKGANLSS